MPERPQPRNPLWMIGTFVSLSEAMAGIAVTQSDGAVQERFALFATWFPVGVATAFFVTLWWKPWAFYSPSDYPKAPNVGEFVGAMKTRARFVEVAVEETARAAVDTLPGAVPETTYEEIVSNARAAILNRAVTVSLQRFRRPDAVVLVENDTTVQDFLDEIYFALAPAVGPYEYGDKWVLVDPATGRSYEHLGGRGARRDKRSLSDVGIEPGAALEAVPV